MPDRAIRIEGLRELQAAFAIYDAGLAKGVREALEAGAEVVRPTAETLATGTIKRSEIDWTRMRTGVLSRVGFVAPVERGKRTQRDPRRGRPNLKPLLLDRALEPALDLNRERVQREFEDSLVDLARIWSRV
jgi:hypothetical protein